MIPFCAKSTELGQPHKMLRSLRYVHVHVYIHVHVHVTCNVHVHNCTFYIFRRLLFLAPDNFLTQPAGVGDIIPYSYVLNLLFSYAPPGMKSPHQVCKLLPLPHPPQCIDKVHYYYYYYYIFLRSRVGQSRSIVCGWIITCKRRTGSHSFGESMCVVHVIPLSTCNFCADREIESTICGCVSKLSAEFT